MSASKGQIHVGVAGWSYPDWEGFVYPRRLKDPLSYLAPYLDMIEINSTFYRPPSARHAESWAAKTAALPDFFFSAKLHRDVTHEHVIVDEMVRAFRDGLQPLVDADKLRHLLAQFRYDFADAPPNRDHLSRIRERFGGIAPVVLELRHKSWQSPEGVGFLRSLGVTVANLDYPLGRDSFGPEDCVVGETGYFRLHGRNAAAWFDQKAGRDQTYNYYYGSGERKELVDRALRLAVAYRALTIVANNHYEGKEVANALQIKAAVQGTKVRVPPDLLRRYSELKAIAVAGSVCANEQTEFTGLN